MNPTLKYTTVTDLLIEAKPGSHRDDCTREAVLLAATEWRNVTLIHNNRRYRVLCNDLLACAKEQS